VPHHSGVIRSLVLLLSLLPGVVAAQDRVDTEDPLPRRLWGETASEDASLPVWIASEEAITEGRVRWELLPPHTRSYFDLAERSVDRAKKLGTRSSERCLVHLSLASGETGGTAGATIDGMTQSAQRAVTGRIVASRSGFLRGTPSTLYRLEVEVDTAEPPAVRYFFYPVAELTLGGETVCFGPAGVSSEELHVGDEVALLIQPTKRPETGPVLMPLRGELVVRQTDGAAKLLEARDVPMSSFSRLTDLVKRRASAGGRRLSRHPAA